MTTITVFKASEVAGPCHVVPLHQVEALQADMQKAMWELAAICTGGPYDYVEINRLLDKYPHEATSAAQPKPKRTIDDFDVWWRQCDHCGHGRTKGGDNRCWKCGRQLARDFSDSALKNS